MTASEIDTGLLLMKLLGGLAIFLFGMELMTDALKLVAGRRMKNLLARLTTNRFKGVFAGAFVTSVIQSSSVTTVLVVGFISAGLMTLSQSIGVILGADIGTTITAQIIAFKITHYAMLLIAAGFILKLISKSNTGKEYGLMIIGLGLIFFGMEIMSEATYPLRKYEPFLNIMQHMSNPFIAILIGTVFTALIQSSSATMGIIIVLASQGTLTLETGIVLAFGANIGTCITAMLAAIGKPRDAVRAAFIHVLFKIVGVLIWLVFLKQLMWIVIKISPAYLELEGLARLAAETPRQIANAHTVFNIANTFVFIWFTEPLVKLMYVILPDRPEPEEQLILPKYLDKTLLENPVLALDRVRMELRRIGDRSYEMVSKAFEVYVSGTEKDLNALAQQDDVIDRLHESIVSYLRKLSQLNLSRQESTQIYSYMKAVNNIESIGDMIETNIVQSGLERIKYETNVSEATREVLSELHQKVCWCLRLSLQALDASNELLAEQVIESKAEINKLAREIDAHLRKRLTTHEADRITLFRMESELVEYLKRVYYFSKRIAKATIMLKKIDREDKDNPK